MLKNPTRQDRLTVEHATRMGSIKISTFFAFALLLISLGQSSVTQATLTGSDNQDFNTEWFNGQNSISRDFIQSGRLFSADDVQRIYEQNSFRPLWDKRINNKAWFTDAMGAFGELKYDALPMWRYHREQFALLKDLPKKTWLLDIYLTDALVTAIKDLTGQRLPNEMRHEKWKLKRESVDLSEIVSSLRYEKYVSTVFQHQRPAQRQYELLRYAYKRMQGRTQKLSLSEGDRLLLDSRGVRVMQLARLLESEGLLQINDIDLRKPTFNEIIEQSVIDFQRLHGIKVDGIVGKQTRALLNSGSAQVSMKIARNLQHWRIVAGGFHTSHILVNSAAYNKEPGRDDIGTRSYQAHNRSWTK